MALGARCVKIGIVSIFFHAVTVTYSFAKTADVIVLDRLSRYSRYAEIHGHYGLIASRLSSPLYRGSEINHSWTAHKLCRRPLGFGICFRHY
jgi:hypothetical protein